MGEHEYEYIPLCIVILFPCFYVRNCGVLGTSISGMQEGAKRVRNHNGVLSVDCDNLVLIVLTKTLQECLGML